jgi:hypothetical protein
MGKVQAHLSALGVEIGGILQAVQIRLGPTKGLVALDFTLGPDEIIELPRSMVKYMGDPKKWGKMQRALEVCPQGIVDSRESKRHAR